MCNKVSPGTVHIGYVICFKQLTKILPLKSTFATFAKNETT